MKIKTKHTFCRICESLCGLEVDTIDNKIVNIRPDANHITTYGFACPNYFTTYKTKKTIEGKFHDTCAVELEGKTFSIRYKYKKKKGILYLKYKGKWHPYKRFSFDKK